MTDKPSQKYLGNGKHRWEYVVDDEGRTMRLRVPGGYLYRYLAITGPTMVFVPMPQVVKHKV